MKWTGKELGGSLRMEYDPLSNGTTKLGLRANGGN